MHAFEEIKVGICIKDLAVSYVTINIVFRQEENSKK